VLLKERVTSYLNALGINKAVGYGVLTRLWGLVSVPATMYLIVTRFSKEQQGFYYTMYSLLALQVFFELGLLYVVAQFASHEFVDLQWGKGGKITGDPVFLSRFVDLLTKTTLWFIVVSGLLTVVLIPLGLFFFSSMRGTTIDFAWHLPWILAVLGTAINLLAIPFFSIIMGSGDVVSVNQRELLGALLGSCISWVLIVFHGGLYAVFAVTCGNAIVSWSFLLRQKPELLKLAWKQITCRTRQAQQKSAISWWGEIWPMQWKMAISFFSGYFIFQLFNPVLFHFYGPIVAGQMGMTLSVFNALLTISTTWMAASSPEFGKLIAKKAWKQLDKLFFTVQYQSIGVVTAGAIVAGGLIGFLQANYQIGQRFLPLNQAALLFASAIVVIINNGFAVYLRAHKTEPLMIVSVIIGILQALATWYLGMHYSSLGVVLGLLIITTTFALPAVYSIWQRFRATWHGVNTGSA
jgi:O-antigen/teichoic acid export membrane protein